MPREEFDAMITEAYDNGDFLPLGGLQMTVVNESRARITAEQGGLASLQDESNGSNPAAYWMMALQHIKETLVFPRTVYGRHA